MGSIQKVSDTITNIEMTRINLYLVNVLVSVFYINGTAAILWPCTTNLECSAVPTAWCSEKFHYCQCPAGYVFSADVTKCLKESLYGETCTEGAQCSHMLSGAKCDGGYCTCDTGYTYVKGRCRKLANLHENCNQDIDCFFSYNREAVVCNKNKKCECANEFYERSTNVCRRKAYNGDFCAVQTDCHSPSNENLKCIKQKCTDTSNATTKYYKDIAIQTQFDSISPPKEVIFGPDYSSLGSPTTTRDESTQFFGDSCREEGLQCAGLPYSVCRRGLCHCEEGYYNVNGKCKAELGEYVATKADCGNTAAEFRNNRCLCKYDQFYKDNMRECVKSVLGIGTSCTLNSQCSPYGVAYCPSASPKQCKCFDYATYNAEKELCELKKGFEEYCATAKDCTLPNTQCTVQNTCICQPYYFYVNETCKAGKGKPCETANDCAFEQATCMPNKDPGVKEESEKTCECKDGFVYHNNKCYKQVESLDEKCEETEQCKPLLGDLGQCIKEKCDCDEENTHFKGGKCNPKVALNEKCKSSNECYTSDEHSNKTECRNSLCQCKFDYQTDTESQVCKPKPKGSKNGSGRPSALKVITLLLTSAAVLITGSALKQAYYP